MSGKARYVPAAGRRVFTRVYDPVIALTMRERAFRGRLLEQVLAGLPAAGGRIVDVGCGTGTFAIALTAAAPAAEVTGVDGDPAVLAIAQRKRGAERVAWTEGLATSLPAPDEGTDRVVMSLLLHHLAPAAKRRVLAEALRVLRPGGRLHIADWGRPHGLLMPATFLASVQLVDGLEGTRDHAAGRAARAGCRCWLHRSSPPRAPGDRLGQPGAAVSGEAWCRCERSPDGAVAHTSWRGVEVEAVEVMRDRDG
jgi:SAM-dependent methyltransferase